MKIGIDLGGSHIGVGLVDNNGNIKIKREMELYNLDDVDIETYLEQNICKLIYKVLDEGKLTIDDIEFIGIAAPGIVRKGVIVKSKNLNISKYAIVTVLKKEFQVDISLKNDGKAAALAEREYGNLTLYNNSIFLNIGTGIGGAVFENGKLLESAKGCGYEFGHMIVNRNGRKCSCGKNGCFEAYASIGNLKKIVKEKLNLEKTLSGKAMLEILLADESNKYLEETINDYIDYLSIGISNLVNIFEPECIVIGGSFAYYETVFLEKLKENLRKKKYIFNEEVFPKIIMAQLKNDAGIIGATIEKK